MPDATPSQSALLQQLSLLADLPGVREVADRAREAGTRLRFHEALRRRIPEAAADLPVELVRELRSGARPWPDELDPGVATLKGAVAATAETERVVGLVRTAPLQALATLHVAAASPLVGAGSTDTLGRPRVGDETCHEFVDLGPAPAPAVVSSRLAALSELILAGA